MGLKKNNNTHLGWIGCSIPFHPLHYTQNMDIRVSKTSNRVSKRHRTPLWLKACPWPQLWRVIYCIKTLHVLGRKFIYFSHSFTIHRRSVLYQIDTSALGIPPIPVKIELPSVIKIRQVSDYQGRLNALQSLLIPGWSVAHHMINDIPTTSVSGRLFTDWRQHVWCHIVNSQLTLYSWSTEGRGEKGVAKIVNWGLVTYTYIPGGKAAWVS